MGGFFRERQLKWVGRKNEDFCNKKLVSKHACVMLRKRDID